MDWTTLTGADSPARRVILLLLRRGPRTVSELVSELGVTATAVRQQVDKLASAGWIRREKRRGGPGRPADVLSVTEQARRLFGGEQADALLRLLVDELTTSLGRDQAREILAAVGRRLAAETRGHVGNGEPAERLREFARLLGEQGTLVEAGGSDDGLKLTVFTCPYPELSSEHDEICEMERRTMSELLDSEVKLERCMRTGHRCCEFAVER